MACLGGDTDIRPIACHIRGIAYEKPVPLHQPVFKLRRAPRGERGEKEIAHRIRDRESQPTQSRGHPQGLVMKPCRINRILVHPVEKSQ